MPYRSRRRLGLKKPHAAPTPTPATSTTDDLPTMADLQRQLDALLATPVQRP
ncbi:hypothetical protein [Mycobacteroides abscessus]|uniref:hypothetical protein n=1 Tax=Mycobacteroides abscessus TaxID=36809 RepID=UPI000A8952F0|nr:hypothetical protein [Mycobacteroides abscessus]